MLKAGIIPLSKKKFALEASALEVLCLLKLAEFKSSLATSLMDRSVPSMSTCLGFVMMVDSFAFLN